MTTRIKGTHSKYRDDPEGEDNWMPAVHKDQLYNPRAYTPNSAGTDPGSSQRGYSHLIEESNSGDWSWKPARDRALGDHMTTFHGVPPSAAEICRSTLFSSIR